MIRLIRHTFATPSAFLDHWQKFFWNQVGHALCVGLVPVAVFGSWGLVILPLYALWETSQWQLEGADVEDCLRDMAFVTAGALALWHPPMLMPMALHLAAGVARRIDNSACINSQFVRDTMGANSNQ